MSTVLVTGAAGFIGTHVRRALCGSGHKVIGLDVTPYPMETYGEEGIMADITKPLPPIPGLDAVIHLAALAAPRECDANPTRAFDINVNGTLQVLRMALDSGATKFVFSSSAHVYGISPHYLPTPESHPLALGNTYTTTKILGEQLCSLYFENHGLSYTTLRLFNAYGPGQALGYFIPDMMKKAKSGDIDLGPGGHVTKDWVWVEDVARAFVLALETPYVGPINIGTGVETALHLIAGRIASENGHVCKVDAANESATRMCGDIARAERILGWTPKMTLKEGLSGILNSNQAIMVQR